MGFFSDLKEDLSQAVNELIPEDGADVKETEAEAAVTVQKRRRMRQQRDLRPSIISMQI